jgi:hypothetical protein
MTRAPTLFLFAALVAAPAMASEFDGALRALADERLRSVASDPSVIEAIRARNAKGAPAQAEIERMDSEWRASVGAGGSPLISAVLDNPAAQRLKDLRDASEGLITEAFAMDASGLNVAASDPTSDYWQGDEAKWQESYGRGELHLGAVEFDESSQTYQAQISLPVADPEDGQPIGAVTFGVNVEYLE